jgi:hypothetical protein
MGKERPKHSTGEEKPKPATDINLPPRDIRTEPGQPSFKQALGAILSKPKGKDKDAEP